MANLRLIKRRIKSAQNISQITRAMQMVAASKMKKAQGLAVSGRPYAEKIAEMVTKFVARIDPEQHPLLKENTNGKDLVILITTNKGLCGGLNTNLLRSLQKWFKETELASFQYVTLGKRGETYLVRGKRALLADFSEKIPFSQNIPALTTLITDGYIKGEFKRVEIVYNNFLSALRQEPTHKQLLPIKGLFIPAGQTVEKPEITPLEFLVEPDVESILDPLLFHYLENQVRDAVLQAEASEHSARMMAMKNATDNAREFIELLTLEYYRARQEKITYEISDMVTARLAVS
ncbi:MAG: ATP synthase gamma chain [Candidatus Gottesmanbacteria bacterium GW2011_GWB1_43_11]|uniref:ATP synthase gamma chain n=1 Tax=Candidatus Gottesmanbacteria bacterium GW2011_GWB1_43_11 TaxID=1618446 RepID=A0A0G1FHP9_9BACT|nr:MAG: ATP synthase gamma chain [Candidatus Gottesmanbacteria bacterium GW2011_GWA2_42_16]KKS55805.1 MAG: ATP synthase gamma chain [Candidatus Gottesmanbacteria bacterium GW2011_GWA1_42_26]KKS82013.1 MAG: ATP synthase gamma chain [Candidatus Gottesmanbacteria bacterium GW2011_GWC1_43_10]KKS86373.1 MAG: ATP synthase gamma chain [Candidatus Gottesmanbacteria bacterium GW2011_GWB1_43_11]OGG07972.1 MAG: ATP synthase F1 subunit gamma [Candidatus Gottesmanbacteria bacterium RIFCSPHIGHO2_01_FULL_43_1